MTKKQCTSCKKQLPKTTEYFHKSNNYLHSQCKICRSNVIIDINEDCSITKSCNKCKEVKPATLEFFHKSNRSKDGLRFKCKTCRAKDKLEYSRKNKSKILKQSKEYR